MMNEDQTNPSVGSPTPTDTTTTAAAPATARRRKQVTKDPTKGTKLSPKPANPTRAAARTTVLPAKLSVPTAARELAQTVLRRLGPAQALRVYHSLGALLKKAA